MNLKFLNAIKKNLENVVADENGVVDYTDGSKLKIQEFLIH